MAGSKFEAKMPEVKMIQGKTSSNVMITLKTRTQADIVIRTVISFAKRLKQPSNGDSAHPINTLSKKDKSVDVFGEGKIKMSIVAAESVIALRDNSKGKDNPRASYDLCCSLLQAKMIRLSLLHKELTLEGPFELERFEKNLLASLSRVLDVSVRESRKLSNSYDMKQSQLPSKE